MIDKRGEFGKGRVAKKENKEVPHLRETPVVEKKPTKLHRGVRVWTGGGRKERWIRTEVFPGMNKIWTRGGGCKERQDRKKHAPTSGRGVRKYLEDKLTV